MKTYKPTIKRLFAFLAVMIFSVASLWAQQRDSRVREYL